MSRRYRLFAFDLDGTLLSRDGRIPPGTREFLADLSTRARVTLATGRSLASARRYLAELSIATPAILYHGAVVFDPIAGRPLREAHIPGELACRVFEVSKRFSVHPQIYRSVDDPTIYTTAITPPIRKFVENENLHAEPALNIDEILEQGPLKLLFIGDPEIIPELTAVLQEEVPELTVVRSERSYIEVLPPGISKGEALSWLCKKLGIPLAQTVAVGDQESDISMIERAGLGVAMANGAKKLMQHANYTIEKVQQLKRILKEDGF